MNILDQQDTEPTTDDPDTGAWPPWLAWLLTGGTFIVAIVAALLLAGALTGLGHTKVSTFTDPLGRDCTQLTKGSNLALSCAPKPFESRLADGLRNASERAS